MEMCDPFKVNEWNKVFNVDDILDDKVLPSSTVNAVVGGDMNLGTPFNFDIDLSGFDDNGNGPFVTQDESIQHRQAKMSGPLPSKSPWHESDSGVSDTRSYVGSPGSPLGNGMEDMSMSVDPQMILPTYDQNVDCDEIGGDLAAYLLGEAGLENENYPETDFLVDAIEQTNSKSLVPVLSATGRPVRKCTSKKVNVDLVNDVSDSEESVSSETQNSADKSKSNADALNYYRSSAFSPGNASSDIKIVRVLKQPACAADATTDDIMKALDERSRKNAKQAKINREKKKAYVQGLESDLENLKKENRDLLSENCEMKSEMANLADEVQYLKSVLANASALSGLLQNISNVKEVKLSANIRGRKRSGGDDHSYNMVESGPQKRARMVNDNLKKAGVCLHVSDGEACLEFCAHCASLASKTHGRASAP